MTRWSSHLSSTEGLRMLTGGLHLGQNLFPIHPLIRSPKYDSPAQLRRNPPMNLIYR
ncbi:MAG: hypothetical protein GY774_28195 [Planctomycetes bacterium]|nr:hypothetical protein [Planctomycetota bacterium]